MVDLAKIRKKAKKILGTDEPQAKPAAEVSAPSGGEDAERRAALQPAPPVAGRPEADQTSKLDRFKEQAGKRRVAAETKVAQETAALLELLTFVIASESYAVEIERIVEIVTPRAVTRIPNADSAVLGIMSLRGTIVTLVDVRRKLRHAAGTTTDDTRIVVIDFRNETVGFVVDRVQRVVKIPASTVEPHPVVHTNELQESIRGVFRVSGALTILLDLDKLLDHT
ncbi:MAG TPA: chemotaxis protein CheW [Thermoanaerobaculia bacterium]|jgi:purine-binding chemotaxis protein CheW